MITQRQRLLKELRKGKVNSYDATYDFRIKQAPTRIQELRVIGYNIVSHPKADRSVDWELLSEPAQPKVLMDSDYEFKDGVAILRPSGQLNL